MDRVTLARVVACFLITAGALGAGVLRANRVEPAESVSLAQAPYHLAGYRGVDLEVSEGVIEALQSDALLLREYREPHDLPVWLLVDYHRAQTMGAQVHSPLTCYPGAGWSILSRERGTLPGAEGRPVRWLELGRGDESMLAMYWYETRWGRSARETSLKIGLLRSALARRASDAAIVRLSTPIVDGDVEAARGRLLRFLEAGAPHVEHALPFALDS